MKNEELVKELEFIQSCINRMSNCSFLIKGWSLSIFSGVTAFSQGDNLKSHVLFWSATFIPIIMFWILDAYFLHLERRYRAMYADRLNKRKNNDYSELFELDPSKYNVEPVRKILFSFTLFLFYLVPLGVSFVCYIFA